MTLHIQRGVDRPKAKFICSVKDKYNAYLTNLFYAYPDDPKTGWMAGRFSSGELTDEEAEERAQKIIDTCGAPELNNSGDFLAPEDIPPCMRG